MRIANVTLLGTGVLGAQIALQAAWHGFAVTAYGIDEVALEKGRDAVEAIGRRYLADLPDATQEKVDAVTRAIIWTTDLNVAAASADLVIEAIPENLDLKREVYQRLGAAAPAHTIFASNSSTLLPGDMAGSTGRPDRFLALHFANEIWVHNLAEIMGHAGTSPEIFKVVVEFARAIGMEPIVIHKEKAGYVLNSLLVPFLSSASELLVDGVAEFEAIDKAWKIATGSPKGPFEIYDIVGLGTAWHISSSGSPKQREFAEFLKQNYIDKGKMGVASGEGFYKYKGDGTPS
ncbi:3-hydroxyacyl-CoA dehydrogenase [Brucella rhizosphaerae]|uniref:3-hydroxyacyl-CoA dehydrogenase n=1 Tax=Brucella rhizosphaerae TaxID=571254 RepID=UPI0004647C6E|nr:3-hydroxyacyl-CoA dehydrogenase [Brucella rhizosphaerae]